MVETVVYHFHWGGSASEFMHMEWEVLSSSQAVGQRPQSPALWASLQAA